MSTSPPRGSGTTARRPPCRPMLAWSRACAPPRGGWRHCETASRQPQAVLCASLLAAAVTARVTGRPAAQLQAAVEHRSLLDRAIAVLGNRGGMDGQAALG